jgi:hypothetical protein
MRHKDTCTEAITVMDGDLGSPRGEATAKRYIEVLEEYLPTILNHDSIFMQDNAKIHKAHKVLDWFSRRGLN